MIDLIQQFVIRNMQHIPYFFERKHGLHLTQYNYALMGRLSASLLHDILTPITALSMVSSVSERDAKSPLSVTVSESTRQITEFVDIMKQFLQECGTQRLLHINEEIRKSIRLMAHKALQNGVQIQFLELDQVHSTAHPLFIYQVIVNLVSNAIDASATSKDKKVILIIKRQEKIFTIECKDFGPGISRDVRKAMCKPGFTTKSDGHGFGLYSVRRIVTQSLGGTLSVYSEPDMGSLFSCRLPIRE